MDTFAVGDFITPIIEQADRGRIEAPSDGIRRNKDGSYSRRLADGNWVGMAPGESLEEKPEILVQRNPSEPPRVPTSHDILFPQHPDGPCINIGLFYIRPTITTLQWFHDFLEWYHLFNY